MSISSRSRLILKSRNDLMDIYQHAIDAVNSENLIKNNLDIVRGKLLVKRSSQNDSLEYDLSDTNIHVIGGGKSVIGMARGLADVAIRAGIHKSFSHGLLSVPVGLKSKSLKDQHFLDSIEVKCAFGSGDNLPDEDSVKASEQILDIINQACIRDQTLGQMSLFIVLISGGGSACLTSPRYLSLSKKLEITKLLVQRGASITELNTVRRYFSNIKGGRLATHIFRANPKSRILTLILSDVVGDPIEFIASGPTYLGSAHRLTNQREQMCDVLSDYKYPIETLSLILDEQESDTFLADPDRVTNHIIGGNKTALRAAIQRAISIGYRVEDLGSDLQGDTRLLAEKLAERAKSTMSNTAESILVIGGGEATVSKEEHETWGKGGRAQEMALDYMSARLSSDDSLNLGVHVDMFLAGTTDGQDGPTDVAACLASLAELRIDDNHSVTLREIVESKRSHDSYHFWERYKPNWLIKTGLTGTNVMDLYMLSSVPDKF